MGDCDSDDECAGGLICGKKNCAKLYPTYEAIDPESDCCVNQGDCAKRTKQDCCFQICLSVF